MIELLNGIRETVAYDSFSGIKLYHNVESDDYPLHWHTAVEIILPIEGKYTVIINENTLTFGKDDIFIIPPGTFHTLAAPPRKMAPD